MRLAGVLIPSPSALGDRPAKQGALCCRRSNSAVGPNAPPKQRHPGGVSAGGTPAVTPASLKGRGSPYCPSWQGLCCRACLSGRRWGPPRHALPSWACIMVCPEWMASAEHSAQPRTKCLLPSACLLRDSDGCCSLWPCPFPLAVPLEESAPPVTAVSKCLPQMAE